MEEQLREIIAKIAEKSPDFSADADLREELEVDSHRAIELMFEIERVFDIRIPTGRVDEMRTLREAIALVTSLKGGTP